MADSTATPAEAPEPGAEPEQPKVKRTYGRVIVALTILVLIIIAIILLWFLWLRGLPGGSSSGARGQTAAIPLVPLDEAATKAITEKVYAALRATSLPHGAPLTTVVYIAKVAGTSGIPITITLTDPATILQLNPETQPLTLATDCETAVLAAVPEVTSVTVIDTNGQVLGTSSRK